MEEVLDEIEIKKYPAYKDSGVEWLGEIPEHWETLSNKYIFNLKKNLVGKKSSDYVLLSLTLNGVIKRDMENPQGKFPAEFDTYQEVKTGDFIFCLFDVEETPRCIGLSEYDGMITGAYTVLEPSLSFDKRFLYYFYLNLDADKRLRPLYTGLRNTISKENFFSFKTFTPPFGEQTAIAQFLDSKTALIDKAIAIKEKQIELLKERRQILIHNAVTHGLNPNVKMKDSGVEWIGEIPEGWEVKRLKHLFNRPDSKFIDGDWIESKDINGDEIRYLTTGNVGEGQYKEQGEGYITKSTFKKLNCTQVFPNDLLISRLSLPLGRTCICPNINSPIVVSVDVVIARMDSEYNRNYYNYLMNSIKYQQHTELIARGAIMSRISRTILGNIFIPIPRGKEQNEIVCHLDIETNKIQNLITLKQQEIEKLKEYKSSLINSAVTGKIKVC